LHEQRRAAKKSNVEGGQPFAQAQHILPHAVLDVGQPQHAQQQAQHGAGDDADHGHFQCHEEAFDEQRRVALDDAPAEIHGE
jgi:hypothetical protein